MNEYRNPGNDNVTAPRSNQSQRKNCPNQKTALEDLFRFAYFFFGSHIKLADSVSKKKSNKTKLKIAKHPITAPAKNA